MIKTIKIIYHGSSVTEEEVSELIEELIERHGLYWLCGKVDGETAGVNEELLSHFTNMQNGILLAQLVAIEGIEKVSASIDAQNKTS